MYSKIFRDRSSSIWTLLTIFIINLVILNPNSSYSEAARTRLKNMLNIRYNIGCHLPKCKTINPNASAVNLFQVISSNLETPYKTNYIWSNINGPPMVISTSSSQDSDLIVNWESLIGSQEAAAITSSTVSGAEKPNTTTTNESMTTAKTTEASSPKSKIPYTDGFHFNVTQEAAIGLLVEKVVFFDDTDKTGLFTKDKPHVEIDWGQVIWDDALRTIYEKDDFLKSHLRMKPNHKVMNGNILIKLAIPKSYKADRQQEVPHLKLNGQSISIVIIVDGMKPPASYINPRLAMNLVVVVQSPSNQVALDTDSESMISDEYTPGVFRIKSFQFKTKNENLVASPTAEESTSNAYVDVEGQTPEARVALGQGASKTPVGPLVDKSKLGFLYWKEVAYTDRRKIISRTIDVYDNEIPMSMETLPNISQPFYQYFKYQPTVGPKPDYKLYRFEMIFGKGDSSYGTTNFTDFSFVFGIGAAPQEQVFSFLVKFVIFVCFCLPLLVMLAGLGYLTLRKFRRNGDTELLLAADS